VKVVFLITGIPFTLVIRALLVPSGTIGRTTLFPHQW